MKACSRCSERKPLSDFGTDNRRQDRKNPWCKVCMRFNATRWREANPEKAAAHLAKWAQNDWAARNPDKRKAATAAYAAANRESVNRRIREYKKTVPGAVNANTAKRRAVKKKAAPKWSEQEAIREVYLLAKFMANVMGEPYHVDHIVPLQSPLVCGLHVAANLQVLPADQNKAKGNRYWPDMWDRHAADSDLV